MEFAPHRDTGMFAKMDGSHAVSAAEDWQAEKAALLQRVRLSCQSPKVQNLFCLGADLHCIRKRTFHL